MTNAAWSSAAYRPKVPSVPRVLAGVPRAPAEFDKSLFLLAVGQLDMALVDVESARFGPALLAACVLDFYLHTEGMYSFIDLLCVINQGF